MTSLQRVRIDAEAREPLDRVEVETAAALGGGAGREAGVDQDRAVGVADDPQAVVDRHGAVVHVAEHEVAVDAALGRAGVTKGVDLVDSVFRRATIGEGAHDQAVISLG